MDKQFWLDKWEKAETGFHQDEVNPYLQRYWSRLGLAAGSTVLVPLCGMSADMRWLAEQGFQVIGVELSELAVERFFAHWGVEPDVEIFTGMMRYHYQNITIWCGNLFELDSDVLVQVDAIYDRAALIALPDDIRQRYLQYLPKKPRLLVTLCYDQQQMAGPPFSVGPIQVEEYFSAYRVQQLEDNDIWADEAKLQQRGLTALREQVYLLA